MKEMLDFFGMEWRMVRRSLTTNEHALTRFGRVFQALGEAEAELAYLNRAGVIDAIMTDDADAYLFGAKTIIRK